MCRYKPSFLNMKYAKSLTKIGFLSVLCINYGNKSPFYIKMADFEVESGTIFAQ